MAKISPSILSLEFFWQKLYLFTCSLTRTFCKSSVVETTCGLQNLRMFKIDGLNFAIYFKSRVFLQKLFLFTCSLERTFCKSSVVETTCGLQN